MPGRLLLAVAGDLGGELGRERRCRSWRHVYQVGLHGPPRDAPPLADLRVGQAWTLEGQGVVQRLTGDHPAATASLTQALELFRDLSDRHGQAGASINLGELLSLSLAYREARGYFLQALSIARDLRESDEATSKKEAQAKAPKNWLT